MGLSTYVPRNACVNIKVRLALLEPIKVVFLLLLIKKSHNLNLKILLCILQAVSGGIRGGCHELVPPLCPHTSALL